MQTQNTSAIVWIRREEKVTMVMWQVLIGRALKAWNNQLLWPVRGSAVHAFLSKKEKREERLFIKKKNPCI